MSAAAPDYEARVRAKERTAWMILWLAFLIFVGLAIAIPTSLRWFYLSAMEPRDAILETVVGTVQVRQPGSPGIVGYRGQPILEGDRIETDATSKALVAFFDGSVVTIFNNSSVIVRASRRTRFTDRLIAINLRVLSGGIRVGVAPHGNAVDVRFMVETPHATIRLDEGSYGIDVGDASTTVRVRDGVSQVTAQDTTVTARRLQRVEVPAGRPPLPPQRGELDLIYNGSFERLLDGWTVFSEQEVKGDVQGSTTLVDESGGPAVRFTRLGSRNSHYENGIYQPINRDVSDFVLLKLSFDLRVLYQSLSGGGYLGSEYPVMVRVVYQDASGNQQQYVRGFYVHNRDNYPTTNGEAVPANLWVPFEKNLFDSDVGPPPVRLLGIFISASGWDYDSEVRAISLRAQ